MIGSVRWNFTAGFIGFVGTFMAAWQSNILSTVLLRSLYSGVTLFFIAFLFRWVLGAFIRTGTSEASGNDRESELEYKGRQIDLITPGEEHDSLNERNSEESESEQNAEAQAFTPLQPPRLVTKPDIEPQELANALRRMSEE